MTDTALPHDLLIVEDLMLLLLDDKSGAVAVAGTLQYTLGGAVLAELAMRGDVDIDESRSGLNGPKVVVTGTEPPADPILRSAYEKVAEKTRGVQTLLITVGAGLDTPVTERLVERGLIRRDTRKILGLIPYTILPRDDARYETALLERVRKVLEDGETPDARTASVIGLLFASGGLPALHPAVRWSTKVYNRAKDLQEGSWGATAVDAAVARTLAAISVSTAVATGAAINR